MSDKPSGQQQPDASGPTSAPALPLELSRKLKKLNVVARPAVTAPKGDGEAVAVKVRHASAKKSDRVAADAIPAQAKAAHTADEPARSDPLDDPNDALADGAPTSSKPDESPPQSVEGKAETVGELADAHDVADQYDDSKTDAAVDDIIRHEGDEILEAEDAKQGIAGPVAPPKHRHHFLKKRLGTSLGRGLTFIVIVGTTGGIFAVPSARYFVLNRVGVRASLSVTATDAGTLLPLKGVTVSMDGQAATTNARGVATLHRLHLGSQTLSFSRVAYASQTEQVTVGWGENPLSNTVVMKPTGVRYKVKAVDYFSGATITGYGATDSGGSETPADKNGLITLTLDTNGNALATATINAKGYLSTPATLKPNTTNVVVLTPAQPDVYVAKQSGKYNAYTSNADGSNQQVLLVGTGLETNQMSLVTSPDGSQAALVSLRDHMVDGAGNAEQSLTLISLANGNAIVIDHADHIRLLDWNGTTLIYETITSAVGSQSAHYAIMSYDYRTTRRQQLASSSSFDVVAATSDAVFYSQSSGDKSPPGLFKINDDGSGQQSLLDQEVIGLYRTDYHTMYAQTADGWYSFSPDSSAAPQQSTALGGRANVAFVLSPDGGSAAAVVDVNGVPTLQITNVSSGKTTNIATPTPSYPVRWLNNTTLVFRSGGTAPADYGVSITGGMAKKIVSVFGSSGFVAGQ